MNTLTNREKDTCTYTGIFGILFSLTCLVQHFWFTNPHWITAGFAILYIFSLTAFSLLVSQHRLAPVLLIIDAALLCIATALMIRGGIFSLIVLMTFLYTGVIVVLVYMGGLPYKFRQRAMALRAEKEMWKDKL